MERRGHEREDCRGRSWKKKKKRMEEIEREKEE